ncbi:FUB1 (YCR076C) [Zygosaccharomyces parabailii]|nr:FUB1 (YCR076C) [Zygosaccharomyces parabailii]CDH10966.1 uncharacterized protein ZBAI_02752 [Zygosaccharomyces bailii ISA1307]
MSVTSNLALAVHIVATYLEDLGIGNKIVNFNEEASTARASLGDEQGRTVINIVGVEIELHRVMISLYQGKQSLGQAILDYVKDLHMADISFPISTSEFLESRQAVLSNIDSKFRLKAAYAKPSSPGESHSGTVESSTLESTAKLPGVRTEPNPPQRPADMPGWEDEYQVREGQRASGLGRPLQGYGDSDLFPLGQRNPLMADPSLTAPPGGMMLDPMQELSRRREAEEAKNRGPGWIPGSKYDDPFGRPGFGGPGGFGPGGFI